MLQVVQLTIRKKRRHNLKQTLHIFHKMFTFSRSRLIDFFASTPHFFIICTSLGAISGFLSYLKTIRLCPPSTFLPGFILYFNIMTIIIKKQCYLLHI